jgi:hypothetical protein
MLGENRLPPKAQIREVASCRARRIAAPAKPKRVVYLAMGPGGRCLAGLQGDQAWGRCFAAADTACKIEAIFFFDWLTLPAWHRMMAARRRAHGAARSPGLRSRKANAVEQQSPLLNRLL